MTSALPGLRTIPFVISGVIGALLSLTAVNEPAWAVAVLLLTGAVAVAAVLLPWRRLPWWAPLALACAVLLVVGVLLVAVADRSPGSLTLVLLPVVWLAMFGTRRQLLVVLAGVPVVVLVPAWIDGQDPWSSIRTAVIVTAVAASIGYAVQNLVGQIQQSRRAAGEAQRRQRTILDTATETAVLTWSPDRLITQMNRGAERIFEVRESEAVGRLSPADVIGDEAMEALTHAMGFANPADPNAEIDELITGGRWSSEPRSVSGVTARVRSGVRPTWVQMDLSAVVDDRGAAVEYVLVAHDVTDLQRVQLDLKDVQQDLAAVVDVLHASQAGQDVRSSVCARTRALTGADVAAIFEPSGDDLVVTAHDGLDVAALRLPIADDASAAGHAFTLERRVTVSDTRTHPGVAAEVVEPTGLRSLLYEPIRHDGSVVAVLGLGWLQPGRSVTERVGESVWALAAEAGMAMRRERHVRTLESHALLDGLTGLPNRRSWDAAVARLVSPDSAGETVCLAMLDLDHFKTFNDTRGHQAGDELLHAAAQAWRGQLRASDVLARYGGEEFALLLPSCGIDTAVAVVDRLRAATPVGCTVSAGLAQWDGAEDGSALVGRADAALYRAKESGRDRLVVDRRDPVG